MRIQKITLAGLACVASTNAIFLGNLNYTRPDPPANHTGYVRPWSFARSGSFSSNNSEDATKFLESSFPENGFFQNSSGTNSSSFSFSHSHLGSNSTGLDFAGLKNLFQRNATGNFPEEFKNLFKPNASGLIPEGGFLEHLGDAFMPNSSTLPFNVSKTVKQFNELLQVDLSEALKGFKEIANFTEGPSRTVEPFNELLSFVTPFIPQKEDFDGLFDGFRGGNMENAPEKDSEPKGDEPFGDLLTFMAPFMPSQEEKPAAPENNGFFGRMPVPKPFPRPFFAKRDAEEEEVKLSKFHENAARSDDAKEYDGEVATCGYRDVGVKPRDNSEKTQEELAAEKSKVEESAKYLPNRK
ncbi:hypothetical protein HF325_005249 [Metschnikowia pulcherrima]|uniref:Uncharacterized protein n=1 Tax=Metschnikowia pulcherrima TaxID=27326 RepID=A0A8H7GMP4_9ASCO|nr:hypothetical protein HF325_005249 [Metschnikowia pulcherrima]